MTVTIEYYKGEEYYKEERVKVLAGRATYYCPLEITHVKIIRDEDEIKSIKAKPGKNEVKV